jgi:hypothetical protein
MTGEPYSMIGFLKCIAMEYNLYNVISIAN